MFREVITRQPDHAIGYLGLALALRSAPNRAARLCWRAIERHEHATAAERRVIDAYQRYFAVTKQPEIVDPRFSEQPGSQRHRELLAELAQQEGAPAGSLLAYERGRAAAAGSIKPSADLLRAHNAYLQRTRAMPFAVPGYRHLVEGGVQAPGDCDRALERLPRHPRLGDGSRLVAALDSASASPAAPLSWQPPQAKAFDLPHASGGRRSMADYQGKPLLVVFFLGFG